MVMLALVLQKLTFKKEGGKISVRELSAVNAITDFLRSKAKPWLLQTFFLELIPFLSFHLLTP